jgi:hypothetical protein
MNKKVLIIGGGILVIGVGAYLYFTKKDKKEALSSGSVTPTTSGATTPTTTSGSTSAIDSEIPPLSTGGIVTPTTKAPTIQGQEDLDKANDIVVKIKQFQKMSVIKEGQIARWNPTSGLGNFGKPINTYPSAINKLKDDLLKLGYEYKGGIDGVLVKL